MTKAAIIVLADTESHADRGRLTNALQTARECQEAGDDLRVIFDGAGTKWIGELTDENHSSHALYKSLEDNVSVCEYCANAFHAEDDVAESDVETLAEYQGHPSIRQLIADGYEVVTF